ncbi:MAG: sigma-70 family RNA polymerase sigma factor [Clostridia bacterium]|nr:sigma-70 family RNA polymerase sigma factor [Clostridia bacterium]
MDIQRIEELVNKHSNMILQIAYQNTFNMQEAEDITQEVFIKLMSNISKLESEEHIKAWLIRVTINLCRDHNKSFWNKNTYELDEDIKYFDKEKDGEVLAELAKLKPNHRNVIYLYYYQGYKINEIAQILNMNSNTVSSLLTRARSELKDVLTKGDEVYA